MWQPSTDALRLPPVMDAFPTAAMNRAAYLWLAALAACSVPPQDQLAADLAHLHAMHRATTAALTLCPGMRALHAVLCAHLLTLRADLAASPSERDVELRARAVRSGRTLPADRTRPPLPHVYAPLGYLPICLRLSLGPDGAAPSPAEDGISVPPGLATAMRRQGKREDNDEANRTDNFTMLRFKSTFSQLETMMLNRATDNDDLENARKAAEDQNLITLTCQYKRAATCPPLHLDLAPQDADHDRLSVHFTYPEWNDRARAHMPDHCIIPDAEATPGANFAGDPRLMACMRHQFEALHPRRMLLPRKVDGPELDLDALIAAKVASRATGQGSDRIEDSHMAVCEARRLGQAVHGLNVDVDG